MFSIKESLQDLSPNIVLTKENKVVTYNVPKANIPVSPILSLLLICSLRMHG